MKLAFYFLLIAELLSGTAQAQLGMGGTAHPSAALDVQANDKAFYPPRLTTVQRKAMVNPQPGAFVYDLDQSTFYLYDGGNWLPLAFQNSANIVPSSRTATDGEAGDQFGISVAIAGDYAIVGAWADDIGANTGQGSAYIFVRSGNSWTQQAKLFATDNTSSQDYFGFSVAISGDYAVVGAYQDDILFDVDRGSAYIFVRSGTSWTQQAKLLASDGSFSDYFGSSVAISGDYALIGAPENSVGTNNRQGSAYVFVRSGNSWTQESILIASDGAANDKFGNSLAISGDYAIVGAPRDQVGANFNQGAAYVYVRGGGTWTNQAKLTASDGEASDEFGTSVAISGTYALVGAPRKNMFGNNSEGSAYIFERSGSSWAQQRQLVAFDGAVFNQFGTSVAISGDYALVGAHLADIGNFNNQGAAYLYIRNGSNWPLVRKITDNSPAETQNGESVSINNGSFILGGPSFENGKGKVAFGIVDN